MLELRPYQSEIVGKIRTAWKAVRSVLAVLPTGGGKTVVFSAIIHDHDGAAAAAAVVHRKEIVGQISCALGRLEVKHRIIAPPSVVSMIRRKHLKLFGKSFVDPNAQCGVISVQTLTSKSSERDPALSRWINQITLCVFDEGHHYVTQGLWARAVERMARAKLLFVTATPERADGKGLGLHADGFCEVMVEGPTTQWLIEYGYLSRFVYKAPSTDLNMDDLPITASGDVNAKALRARTIESHLVGDVVEHYKTHAPGKKAIVFASDVETAAEIADAFNSNGVRACSIHGGTDQSVRDKLLNEFEFGDMTIVVNVDLFDEGFDVPAVECVILSRVTMSLAKYLQMVGRVLRVMDGKEFGIVIDPVRNWERHGMPNWPRSWTLDGRERGSRSGPSDTIAQRVCLACTQPYEVFYKVCPHCGEPVPEPGGRSHPDQVDGDLMELDVEGMAALFAKLRRADMSDDEYEQDQLARHIPMVGRRADMKRFRAAKHRRAVLKELVAWWIGMQPVERELGEKHRRFYHRFGVDIGTAFALNERDTDALIERIQQRFAEDMR